MTVYDSLYVQLIRMYGIARLSTMDRNDQLQHIM